MESDIEKVNDSKESTVSMATQVQPAIPQQWCKVLLCPTLNQDTVGMRCSLKSNRTKHTDEAS